MQLTSYQKTAIQGFFDTERSSYIKAQHTLGLAEVYGMGSLRRAMLRELLGLQPLQLKVSVVEVHRTIHGKLDNLSKVVGEINFSFPPHFLAPGHKPSLLMWSSQRNDHPVFGGSRPSKNSAFLLEAIKAIDFSVLEKREMARLGLRDDFHLPTQRDLRLADEKHIYPGTVTGRISLSVPCMHHSNEPRQGLSTAEEVIHPKP